MSNLNLKTITFPELDNTYEIAVQPDSNCDNLTAGTALAVLSDSYTEDAVPYKFRRTPYKSRRLMDSITGGTVAWNQPVEHGNFDERTGWNPSSLTVADGVGSYTYSGTAGTMNTPVYRACTFAGGHKIIVFADYKCSEANAVRTRYPFLGAQVTAAANTWVSFAQIGEVASGGATQISITSNGIVGATYSFRNVHAHDLTQMFGSTIADYIYNLEQTTEGAGVAFFRNLFPNAYYPYSVNSLESVSGLSARKAVGKNLLDPSLTYVKGKYINADGGIESSSAYQYCESYIHVLPNTNYVFSGSIVDPGTRNSVAFYDSNQTFIGRFLPATGGTPAQFTTPANCAYIRFNAETKVNFTTEEIQLEFGSTATAYEPYESHTYPFDSTLTLRGIPKLDSANRLYFDGDVYASDGTVTRRYGTRAYQSGDESLTDAITDGTNTVYKLTTATTEQADPFINPQYCNYAGTEEYISETVVPVGHESRYYRDLDAVIPEAPTADGVYTLKCTVSGGVPSYSWVTA